MLGIGQATLRTPSSKYVLDGPVRRHAVAALDGSAYKSGCPLFQIIPTEQLLCPSVRLVFAPMLSQWALLLRHRRCRRRM